VTVQGMLKEATGLNLPRTAVERAINERMDALGLSDRKEYGHDLMHGSMPGELEALIELVVVPESWLFRDPQAFALATEVVKERLANGARVVRILSVPCAGGEEPYSMAMALCDARVPLETFSIDAVDISAACINRAEIGIYGRNAFRAQDLAFRDRYFTPVEGEEDMYQIASGLRQRVRFRQGNLLAADPALPSYYDIIFCRNLLIYFDRPTATAAAERLAALLVDDGVLLAGYAEVPVFTQNGFVPLPYRYAFAMRKEGSRAHARALATLPGAAHLIRSATAPGGSPTAAPGASRDPAGLTPAVRPPAPRHRASASALATSPTPASPRATGPALAAAVPAPAPSRAAGHSAATVGPESAAARPVGRASAPRAPASATAASTDTLLAQARQLADQGRVKEAETACNDLLARAPESAEAYFILGLLAETAGKADAAERELKRCLYLQPDHYEALCHLALLTEQGGNRSAAATLKARAARVYQRQHASG